MIANVGTQVHSWKTELHFLTGNLKVTLPTSDPNRYNYRTDMLGAESDYQGFSSVIIYMQLSEKVDFIQAQYLIRSSPFPTAIKPIFTAF